MSRSYNQCSRDLLPDLEGPIATSYVRNQGRSARIYKCTYAPPVAACSDHGILNHVERHRLLFRRPESEIMYKLT